MYMNIFTRVKGLFIKPKTVDEPKTIDEIISIGKTEGANFKNSILKYKQPFKINDILLQNNNKLGKGNDKMALRVNVLSGISNAPIDAALVFAGIPIMQIPRGANKSDFFKMKINNIVDIYRKAGESGLTPKLYASYINSDGYVFLLELVEGNKICDIQLDKNQQLILLNAYLELGKLNLIQPDPNCGNIYFKDKNIKIIDDLAHIDQEKYSDIKKKLFYILVTLFHLQRINNTELYTFLYHWLTANYSENNIDQIFDITREKTTTIQLEDDLKKEFEHEIQTFLQSDRSPTLEHKGGKRKNIKKNSIKQKTKPNKKTLKNKNRK